MSLLLCSHCGKSISATHKHCPHCGRSISLLGDLKHQVESSRLWQAGLVVLVLLLLGLGWFLRMDSGARWPLYTILVLVAPLVPWLLQLAYKNASPLQDASFNASGEGEGKAQDKAQDREEER